VTTVKAHSTSVPLLSSHRPRIVLRAVFFPSSFPFLGRLVRTVSPSLPLFILLVPPLMDRPDTASATGSSASPKPTTPTTSPLLDDPARPRDTSTLLGTANANAKLANPLAGLSVAELRSAGRAYALSRGIADADDVRAFELGAVLAQRPERWERVGGGEGASEQELRVLEKEYSNKWSQPPLLYLVIVLCSTCAAVQGMVSAWLSSRAAHLRKPLLM
jgi:hypothetical protein